MKVEWQHVHVRLVVKQKNSSRQALNILSDMCGWTEEGLLAVIGPSGCGKTTFLRMLAGRVPQDSFTSGYVHYDGKMRNICQWLEKMAYIGQCDVVYEHLIAKDHVMYSALFNRNKIEDLDQKIRILFDKLDMTKCMHKTMDKLSNGERKRVLIAMELIREPDVIIMDEPTSGLDSTSAFYLVKFLKEFAMSGKIVICSIHQPDERVINLFDKVMVLNMGKTVFFGEKKICEELLSRHEIVRNPLLSFSTHMMELCWFENDGCDAAASMIKLERIFRENQVKYEKSIGEISHFKSKDDLYMNMQFSSYHVFFLVKRSMCARFNNKLSFLHVIVFNLPLLFFIIFVKFSLAGTSEFQHNSGKILFYCDDSFQTFDKFYSSMFTLISTSIMYLNINDLPKISNELAANRYSIISYYFGSIFDGMAIFIPSTILGLLSMYIFIDSIFDLKFAFLSILFLLTSCLNLYFFQNIFTSPVAKIFVSFVCFMVGFLLRKAMNYLAPLEQHSIIRHLLQGIICVLVPSFLQVSTVMRVLSENQISKWLSKCSGKENLQPLYFTECKRMCEKNEPYSSNVSLRISLICFALLFYVVAGIAALWRTICPKLRMRLSKR